jgi:uncharacterized protein YkwD
VSSTKLARSLAGVLVLGVVPLVEAGARFPAATRYNEPAPPAGRSELEKRIEALVDKLAAAERRSAPRPDARLERFATELAALEDETTPGNDLVEAALRLHGIVEPPPHLIVASASVGADTQLLDELRGQLPHALGSGRFARQAAAVVAHGDHVRVVVALQESFLELEPVPRALPPAGAAPLRGRLQGAFERPGAFVTAPDGRTDPLALTGDAHHFAGTFHCGAARGRYQVEVTGEDRFGSTVLANFPIYCSMPAPAVLEVPRPARDAPTTDAASAESAVLALVNVDRRAAGLRPLQPDTRLAEVARAHCRDMLAHGFVGHVSPSTGSAADRVARAKIAAALVLENVARASTPAEVERGLMASPGHRRNILSAEATKLGVGAVISEPIAGQRELLVTQLFLAEEAPFRAATADELRQRLAELRRARGLAPLLRDAALDGIADSVARDLATGRETPQSVRSRLDRSLDAVAARYKSARSLFAVATQITQVAESMKEALTAPGATPALGIGLAVGAGSDGGGPAGQKLAHHAVLIVALPR